MDMVRPDKKDRDVAWTNALTKLFDHALGTSSTGMPHSGS
jgi:hypothetical protein